MNPAARAGSIASYESDIERERNTNAKNLLDTAASAISILLASLGVALLSYARDTFSDRAVAHKPTDDAITVLWLLSVFFAVLAAVLARRQVTDKYANHIRDMSFLALLAGVYVFVWAEHTHAVSITFTVTITIVWLGFFVLAFRKEPSI